MANKVKYGLKNVHYAIATEVTSLGVTSTSYGTPVAWAGAVSLEVNPNSSDATVCRADDSDYYIVSGSSQGFDGTYECAYVPEKVETDVLGAQKDNNGVICEYSNDTVAYCALMFEIDGDDKADRYCMLRVSADRPGISSSTKADTIEVKTQSCDVSIMPVVDPSVGSVLNGKVFYRTTSTTPSATYDAFFSAVSTTRA